MLPLLSWASGIWLANDHAPLPRTLTIWGLFMFFAIGREVKIVKDKSLVQRLVESEYKLGTLLLITELISEPEFNSAMQVSENENRPVGEVLVMKGCINDQLLQAAINSQELLRTHKVSLNQVRQTLTELKEAA
jgi:hypothetical protein